MQDASSDQVAPFLVPPSEFLFMCLIPRSINSGTFNIIGCFTVTFLGFPLGGSYHDIIDTNIMVKDVKLHHEHHVSCKVRSVAKQTKLLFRHTVQGIDEDTE